MHPSTFGRTPRIGVLLNPLSGGNRKRLGRIRRVVAACGGGILRREVRGPDEVRRALSDCAAGGVDLLAVCGGDGTVQAVLTTLFRHHPRDTHPALMIPRSGTTSMIAGDVGAPGAPHEALRRLFRRAAGGGSPPVLVRRPVLRMRIPGGEDRYGMFFGAAGISRGIAYYHDRLHRGNLRGAAGILLTLIRFMGAAAGDFRGALPPAAIGVQAGAEPLETHAYLALFVSTLERLFFRLQPFWGTGAGPLRYTAVRARPRGLLPALPHLLRGKRSRRAAPENGFESRNLAGLSLYLEGPVALDGQLYRPAAGRPLELLCGGEAAFVRV